MKGISAIIATILLLLITIALAGTAYMYVSGMLTGKIQKTITVLSATCSQDKETLTLVISNDGTADINSTLDLRWTVDDGTGAPAAPTFECTPETITPHSSSVCSYTKTAGYSGTIQIVVVGPSNSVPQTVYC